MTFLELRIPNVNSVPLEHAMAQAEAWYDSNAVLRRNKLEDDLRGNGHDDDDVDATLRFWAKTEIQAKATYMEETLRFLSACRRDDFSEYEPGALQ